MREAVATLDIVETDSTDAPRADQGAVAEFIRRAWGELRELHRVRIWPDRFQIIDVNKDFFEVRGLGYTNAEIVEVLRMLCVSFDPQTIHDAIGAEFKEFGAGKRRPWAEDRVM